jgi:peroxiredoxin
MRSRFTFTAAVLLTLGLPAAAPVLQAQETGNRVGHLAPGISLPTLAGEELDIGGLLGETPIVLHFFAVWCSLCGAQMPSLHAAVNRYRSSVRFIGVAVSASQTVEQAKRYARLHSMTHDLVYDARGTAVEVYDVPTTSYVVAIDRAGRIVFTGSGADLDFSAAAAATLGAGGP